MPLRPREQTDSTSEPRIRQLIRTFVGQEVRRLSGTSASLAADVAANTSDITANANAINLTEADIADLQRRQFSL